MADEGGAENSQLFLQDRKTGEVRRITDGKSRNMAPKWSPSGALLAWSSNARNGRDMDIYVAAPTDPHFVRRVKEVSGQWTVSDWSPDETKLLAVEYLSINDSRIHIIEVDTGKSQMIAPHPEDTEGRRFLQRRGEVVQRRSFDLLHQRPGTAISGTLCDGTRATRRRC